MQSAQARATGAPGASSAPVAVAKERQREKMTMTTDYHDTLKQAGDLLARNIRQNIRRRRRQAIQLARISRKLRALERDNPDVQP